MPFTLFHGLLAFFIVAAFTSDNRLKILALAAGLLPDLDGIAILSDYNLFMALHHELLHPPVYGIIFAAIAAFALHRIAIMDWKQSFAVFAFAYMLHPVTDVILTDWPVKLLWPLSSTQYADIFAISFEMRMAANLLLGGVLLVFSVQELHLFATIAKAGKAGKPAVYGASAQGRLI
ncbi:MAG TPA: hypothetical protein HA254_05385 [Candidatus Diapherotrites archaeon]|uniref:Metal-dependent hydrolase n=1 Tax=Candidatus Iainarchaeum sp. TaxID=3101447 RepID=A0A7J4IYZ9_9ARCH|nr:hypothetical protein [Candidatus Diapherotrites archaeon]